MTVSVQGSQTAVNDAAGVSGERTVCRAQRLGENYILKISHKEKKKSHTHIL